MNKEYKSIFVPNLSVNIENYITELILSNKIEWDIKKGKNISKPHCAFWRKDIAKNHPQFAQLTKDYIVELTYIKDLLKCFSGPTIIGYIKKRNLITFRYLDLEKQKTVIYNLWREECEHKKNMAKQVKKANSVNIEDTITTIVINRPSKKSGLTGLM